MHRLSFLAFLLPLSFVINVHGQSLRESEESMAFYADVLVNATKPEHRKMANEQFLASFEEALGMEGAREWPFDSLKWISELVSPDSSLRIFSWQLMESSDKYTYYGFIQNLDQSNKAWDLIKLEDTRPFVNAAELSEYSPEVWYGALYFGIKPFKDPKGNMHYLLMGYNANDSKTNLKIADILTIHEGKATLGQDLFVKTPDGKRPETSKRILIEYSDYSNVRLQFDEDLGMLIYDHVIPYAAPGNADGTILVADGSYEAYKLENGQWNYVEKVFHHIEDEAPRPLPVLDERQSKDIFGRERK